MLILRVGISIVFCAFSLPPFPHAALRANDIFWMSYITRVRTLSIRVSNEFFGFYFEIMLVCRFVVKIRCMIIWVVFIFILGEKFYFEGPLNFLFLWKNNSHRISVLSVKFEWWLIALKNSKKLKNVVYFNVAL